MLTGCGQTGSLYLPQPDQDGTQEAVSEAIQDAQATQAVQAVQAAQAVRPAEAAQAIIAN